MAHRLLYHSTLGSRVIRQKKEKKKSQCRFGGPMHRTRSESEIGRVAVWGEGQRLRGWHLAFRVQFRVGGLLSHTIFFDVDLEKSVPAKNCQLVLYYY